MDKINLPDFNFDLPKLEPLKPDFSHFQLKDLPDIKSAYYAEAFFNRLADYIISFESELDQEHEVGAKLVSFGEAITISIDSMGFWNPQLISFYGFDTNGNKVQLIQHISQISVLLISLPRTNIERPRIGYKLKQQIEEEAAKKHQE